MSLNLDQAIGLRSRYPHFRVLVIGRANSGKTTLLKKVCDSIEDPEIFSPGGKKIDTKIIDGSAERGLHDIENQLVFKSNPQFIFHDSRGFESGSVDETEKVKAFIAERAASNTLAKQLHAIWYCLPTDTNRPLLATDEQFFKTDTASKGISEKVPVIAIFTKVDGLITKAFTQLKDKGFNRIEAKERQIELAQEMLSTNFIQPLMSTKFRPSDYVQMKDMRAKTSSCDELIEKTANALSDDMLKLLFVSVQQNNIDLCTGYAVNWALRENDIGRISRITLGYFPHVWKNTEYLADDDDEFIIHGDFAIRDAVEDVPVDDDDNDDDPDNFLRLFIQRAHACETILEKHFPFPESLQTDSGRAEIIAAICICLEQTFTEASAQAQAFTITFSAALKGYVGSAVRVAVNEKIAVFSPEDYASWRVAPTLIEIIKTHRLRIHPNTA